MSQVSRAYQWTVVGAAVAVGLLAGGALFLDARDDAEVEASPTTSADAGPTLPATPSSAVVEPRVTLPAPAPETTAAAPASTAPATTAPTTEPPPEPTTPPPPSTEAPAVPQPVAPPSDPRAFEEDVVLGGIRIPKLGVDETMREGIRLTTLDKGPGHWPGSAMPGDVGNVVVAAHRTSHGGPFRHIDTLIAGDEVVFTTMEGESRYIVTGTQVVEPNAMWIVEPTDTPTATLFACHPPGSVAQRIVVNLELAS